MLNQHMTIDRFDCAKYRDSLLSSLRRDLVRCRNYLRICSVSINQAADHNDDDMVQLWANQQDIVLQEIESLKQQLKHF